MIATKVDTSERRFEIECKLEAEIASLESWKESREYNNKLTNSMVSILSSLDQRLAKLRETIMPVYNETGSLQYQLHSTSMKNNLQIVLKTSEFLITFYQTTEPLVESKLKK